MTFSFNAWPQVRSHRVLCISFPAGVEPGTVLILRLRTSLSRFPVAPYYTPSRRRHSPAAAFPSSIIMSSKASEATNPPTSSEAPWYVAYPAARNKNPSTLSRVDLLASIKEGKKPGKDFVLVDLRRTDYEGGTIRGSINLPAQSLYPTIPTLYTLFKEAKVGTVIWYCGTLPRLNLYISD